MIEMHLLLQIWGGGCYLLNKMLFAFAEGRGFQAKRLLRLYGWAVYVAGVPAWVAILLDRHNWIAAAIEAGGVPSMLFGLYAAYMSPRNPGRRCERFASAFTYGSIVLGVGYSLYDYGGITSVSQILEIGVTAGFLLGSYLLAKNNAAGWLFFMLMNGSMATLMHMQGKPILAGQQLVSLCFVVYGYAVSRRASRA